jgi:hypothetical protein
VFFGADFVIFPFSMIAAPIVEASVDAAGGADELIL